MVDECDEKIYGMAAMLLSICAWIAAPDIGKSIYCLAAAAFYFFWHLLSIVLRHLSNR